MLTKPRIAIIGAGPIGLESALYARLHGYDVAVYERGYIAEHVRQWGPVRMFSPFGMNSSEWGRGALKEVGYEPPPDDALLTGDEFRDSYLLPLANLDQVRDCIHQGSWVSRIARKDQLKHENITAKERTDDPFEFCLATLKGEFDERESFEEADVILDCTGTWMRPRNIGPGGMPCIGEQDIDVEMRIHYWPYRVSDPSRNETDDWGEEEKIETALEFLVIGSGHSAATTIMALAEYAEREPGVLAHWLTRREAEEPIARIENDPLPERDRLAVAANRLALSPDFCVDWKPGWSVLSVESADEDIYGEEPLQVSIQQRSTDATETLEVDAIIANVGYRPDRSLYEELQVHECYATQGPMKLAAKLLGETSSDCLDQQSHGAEVLRNPEPNFYILGTKSYGRNSNFLIQVGLQQIVDVFSLIEQDWGQV